MYKNQECSSTLGHSQYALTFSANNHDFNLKSCSNVKSCTNVVWKILRPELALRSSINYRSTFQNLPFFAKFPTVSWSTMTTFKFSPIPLFHLFVATLNTPPPTSILQHPKQTLTLPTELGSIQFEKPTFSAKNLRTALHESSSMKSKLVTPDVLPSCQPHTMQQNRAPCDKDVQAVIWRFLFHSKL
jgi:hypothetical protein